MQKRMNGVQNVTSNMRKTKHQQWVSTWSHRLLNHLTNYQLCKPPILELQNLDSIQVLISGLLSFFAKAINVWQIDKEVIHRRYFPTYNVSLRKKLGHISI